MSDQVEPLFGMPAGRFDGQYDTILNAVHPDDRQRFIDTAQTCIKHDREFAIEHRITGQDGSIRWVSQVGNVARDAKSRPIRMFGVVRDITDRKLAGERFQRMLIELNNSRDAHLAVLNRLPLGILKMGPRGDILFINNTLEQLVVSSDQPMIGMPWDRLIPFSDPDKERIKKLLSTPTERRQRFQTKVEFSPGKKYWVEIELIDDLIDQAGFLFVINDISETYDLRRLLDGQSQFGDIIGKSDAMQSVFGRIKEIAKVDWTVLIEGETGTGKELVARAIYDSSPRKGKRFLAVNCVGLAESLLSSQLFGHKRGSFTGAIADHKGFFEVCEGGSLFLDEIGEISPNLQSSLLRVLEAKEIIRVGESQSRKVDVRVLAATARDLPEEVEQGRFRSDLLFRIRVARIDLPPLRDRREDIPLLVDYFLTKIRTATENTVEEISSEAMSALIKYNWPGNVRELRSAIDFARLHCQGAAIDVEDLPPEILMDSVPSLNASMKEQVVDEPDSGEKRQILNALKKANGKRNEAARILGISRATLFRKLSKLGISKPPKHSSF